MLQAESKKHLVNRLVSFSDQFPGSVGQKIAQKHVLEAKVNQIEWETGVRGENEGRGRLPALFMTFTSAVYKWERLNRMIRRCLGKPKRV